MTPRIHIFINKLMQQQSCYMGFMMFKSADIIVVIIERVALTDHYGQYKRSLIHKKLGILELVANDDIFVQNKLLIGSWKNS